MTAQPIAVRVTRYKCPSCSRTASTRARSSAHIARCWSNPEARGCKTCKNFEPAHDACGCEPGCNWGGQPAPESCAVDVSLAGRPACEPCNGRGETFDEEFGASECQDCGGDGAEVKPGPIVHCEKWEKSE